jgi:hypothetical protein
MTAGSGNAWRKGPVEFLLRFPVGHQFAGRAIQRTSRCSCGTSVAQCRLNPVWLAMLRPGARSSFRECCTTTSTGAVYWPSQCVACTRRMLRT